MEPTPAPARQPGVKRSPERRGEGGLPLLISPQYAKAYLTTWMTFEVALWDIYIYIYISIYKPDLLFAF